MSVFERGEPHIGKKFLVDYKAILMGKERKVAKLGAPVPSLFLFFILLEGQGS